MLYRLKYRSDYPPRALNLAKFIARNGGGLSLKLTKFKKASQGFKRQSKLKICKIIVSLAHFLQRSEI